MPLSLEEQQQLEYLKVKREKLAKELAIQEKKAAQAQAKVYAYERANKLLYFNHPDKGHLGKGGTWEYNKIQKPFFEEALYNPEKKIYVFAGANRISKAQWDEETVLTPSGFIRMGNVEVGTEVYSQDGTICVVDGVFPQGVIDAYKVTFDDDSSLIVSAEHLWATQGYYERFKDKTGHGSVNEFFKKWRVRTTLEVIKSGGYSPTTIARKRHIIPTCAPVNFPAQEALIDPYILGCLIGDGGMTASITFSTSDHELLEIFREKGMSIKKATHGKYDYYVSGVMGHLKTMGLHGKKSQDKFVPREYLFNTPEVRLEILRGLMDTDGYLSKSAVLFTTTSKQLSLDIKFLVESLGGKVRVRNRKNFYTYNGKKKHGLDSFSINIFMNELNPFRLSRKASKFKGRQYCQERIIKSIEKLDSPLPCTCISVTHPSHLYLAKDFIVTHNTFSTTGCTAISLIRGNLPWKLGPEGYSRKIWDIRGWEPPIKGRIVGQDWEKHVKTVLIPTIQELWPKSWKLESRKNNVGVEAYWHDPLTGSSIEILSNNSDSDLFEGWSGHFVIYDEPPKRDNRVACARGLIDYNGIELFGMTLLKEAWVDRDVINATLPDGRPDPSVWSIVGDISVNVGHGISQEGVDQFAKTLTEEEKDARLKGIPSYKSGVILNLDRDKHFIRRFEIPSHYLVDVSIDIGVSKPNDILYLATAPNGFKYVIFEETVAGDGEAIADSIIKKKNRYNLRLNRIVCDPLAKADKNNENSQWDKIDRHLNRFGHVIEPGSKDKNDGIIAIKSHLQTVNGLPALFFFNDLVKTIHQATYWMWEQVEGKDGIKEIKAQKKDDDMCENLYRLMLLDTQYFEPNEDDEDTKQHSTPKYY